MGPARYKIYRYTRMIIIKWSNGREIDNSATFYSTWSSSSSTAAAASARPPPFIGIYELERSLG